MKRKKACLTIAFVLMTGQFCLFLSLLPAPVEANILYVGGSGPSNYTVIQNAINDAVPGDTIYVYAGIYNENITISKPLTLLGEDKNTTIIDGGKTADTIYVDADSVNITGFSITGAGPDTFDAAVDLYKAKNCSITDNIVNSNALNGVLLTYSDHNLVAGNEASYNGRYGINIWGSRYNNISNNNIRGNTRTGIDLDGGNGNLVKDNTISEHQYGIYLRGSSSNILDGNTVSSSNQTSIYLDGGSYNTLTNNQMLDNGIFILGYHIRNWVSPEIDTSNTVNGKPVHYWKNSTGGKVPEGAGQVIIANCSNVLVENQELNNATAGMIVALSSGIEIRNNTATGNSLYGFFIHGLENSSFEHNYAADNFVEIEFEHSNNNTIANNSILSRPFGFWYGIVLRYSNYNEVWGTEGYIYMAYANNNSVSNGTSSDQIYGIFAVYSENNTFANYTLTDNLYGIHLDNATNNTILESKIAYNTWGVWLEDSSNNTILENTVAHNAWGVWLEYSDNNSVYHNSILGNTDQAQDYRANFWDDSYPSGGNCWSDYFGVDQCSGPNQDVCPDPDGIGDTPYVIDTDSRDNYPLMSPPVPDVLSPTISISSPTEGQDFYYSLINVTGAATDFGGSGLRNVEVRLNGGSWSNATGTSSWNTSVNLILDLNVIEARAWDNAGNPSEIVMVNVTRSIMPEPRYAPIASFTVSPSSGNVTTLFFMNASSSSDIEDPVSALEIRWDWEDDGSWDTSWSTEKTELHQYADPSTYTIRLEVRDTHGLTNNTTRQLTVTPVENQPPMCDINEPISGETIKGTYIITGEASDPDGTVQSVEVRIDSGIWVKAVGTTDWRLTWETTAVSNGEHTLYARSFDGTNYSTETNVTFFVGNEPSDRPYDWTWIVIVILIAVATILVFWIIARRRKEETEDVIEPPQEDLIDEHPDDFSEI